MAVLKVVAPVAANAVAPLLTTIPARNSFVFTVATFKLTVAPESTVIAPINVFKVAPLALVRVLVTSVVPVIISANAKVVVPAETQRFPGHVIPVVTHSVAAPVVLSVVPALIVSVGNVVFVHEPANEIVLALVVASN